MNGALAKLGVRYFARHPWQLVLAILGTALGVAVVIAIDLANTSAKRAFTLSAESIAGRATHRVTGGPDGLDEAVYVRLRRDLALRSIAPAVSGWLRVHTADGSTQSLQLLGVDVFAERPLRPYLAAGTETLQIDLGAFLTEPGAVVLTADTARSLGVAAGGALELEIGGRHTVARLVGTLEPREDWVRSGLAQIALTDIATAQELLGRIGRLDHIDLRIDDADTATLERIRAALPASGALQPIGARTGALRQLSSAFETNLQALSLLTLLVGAFLIYNTMQFAVVQRRRTFGIARALGAPRAAIVGQVLVEAALIGTAATLLGILGGSLLATQLVGAVAATINDFYFSVNVTEISLSRTALARGLLLGIGVSILAALPAALEAVATEPREVLSRSALEARARRIAPRTVPFALLLTAAGAALLAFAGRNLIASYAGLFVALVGIAGLVPLAVALLSGASAPLLARIFGVTGSLAARGAARSLSRTAVATAALTLAIAATVGLGVMIGSFRASVTGWLQSTLQADVYVSVPRPVSAWADGAIDDELAGALLAMPGVAAGSTYRRAEVDARDGERIRTVAITEGAGLFASFRFVDGVAAAIRTAFDRGAAIVSEPLAFRRGLLPGDTIELRTAAGWHRFPVAGVFYDYGSERGAVMLDDRTFRAHWPRRPIASLALRANPDTDADTLAARVRALDTGGPALSVHSNRELRRSSIEIFDRTFAITGILRLLCAGVAFLGIWSALMALQLERTKEIGVLRAIGATPRHVRRLVLGQTALLGWWAGILALPVGGVLAWILIEVINRRSFGWTLLQVEIAPRIAVEAVALSVGAALLAGIHPARRLARTEPARSLREE